MRRGCYRSVSLKRHDARLALHACTVFSTMALWVDRYIAIGLWKSAVPDPTMTPSSSSPSGRRPTLGSGRRRNRTSTTCARCSTSRSRPTPTPRASATASSAAPSRPPAAAGREPAVPNVRPRRPDPRKGDVPDTFSPTSALTPFASRVSSGVSSMRGGSAMVKFQEVIGACPRWLRRQLLLRTLTRLKFVPFQQEIEFNGVGRAVVDLRDPDSCSHFLSKEFAPEYFPILSLFLPRPSAQYSTHVLDVGSNFGLITFGLLEHARSNISWHLFEANPAIVDSLARSASLWPDREITINHCCVTDTPGVSMYNMVNEYWGQGQVGLADGHEVSNLRLDDYIFQRKIKNVALLKMDIEGWEPHALAGAEQSLLNGTIKAGWVELHPIHLARTGNDPGQLITYIELFGFDCYWCGLWNCRDSHLYQGIRLSHGDGTRIEIDGTELRVAPAKIATGFLAGDVLIVHRTSPLSDVFRQAFCQIR